MVSSKMLAALIGTPSSLFAPRQSKIQCDTASWEWKFELPSTSFIIMPPVVIGCGLWDNNHSHYSRGRGAVAAAQSRTESAKTHMYVQVLAVPDSDGKIRACVSNLATGGLHRCSILRLLGRLRILRPLSADGAWSGTCAPSLRQRITQRADWHANKVAAQVSNQLCPPVGSCAVNNPPRILLDLTGRQRCAGFRPCEIMKRAWGYTGLCG